MTPDEVVLNKLIEDFAQAEYPGDTKDDVFEKFSVSQLIKPRDLTPDELAAGIVDNSKDGGIDSFYVFVNGALLDVDDPLLEGKSSAVKGMAPNPEIEVFLIQSKNQGSWKEAVWEHLLSTLPNVLNLDKPDAELETLYNTAVVERTGIFRRVTLSLASKFPRVKLRAVYVARAQEGNITATIESRAEQVRKAIVSSLTAGASVSVDHIGIEGLYRLAGTTYSKPASLKFRSLLREEHNSFLGVVTLEDYLSFVRDESGALREELFDSNVRDYEGDNLVNEAIGQTLSADDGTEFWWLNNGVTVLGDKVDSPQKSLTISGPLIVNGLQTSHVLHRASNNNAVHQSRLANGIVVRVIVSTDEEVRDRIIAGTNRQTRVPTPALYATRPNQIKIENYFIAKDFYYERRKNRYKNQGQPAKKRITMNLLAQTMIATLLGRPDDARARPSTLLSREKGYESIFPDGLDLEAYLRAIEILRGVDDFLRTSDAKSVMDDFTNARFYVLTGYCMLRAQSKTTESLNFDKNFKKIALPLSNSTLKQALVVLASTTNGFARTHRGWSTDSMFKSSDFRDKYFTAISRAINASTKTVSTAKKVAAKKSVAKKVAAKKTVAKKAAAKKTVAKSA